MSSFFSRLTKRADPPAPAPAAAAAASAEGTRYAAGAAGASRSAGLPARSRDPAEDAAAAAEARAAEMDRLARSLGDEYYDPKFDAVRHVLGDMPMDEASQEAFLRSTKMTQQRLLDAVSARLSREVVANYQAFINGMKQISEIDMDCSRAGVHISNSLRKLGNAKQNLVLGTLGITYRRRRRERLAETVKHLRWVQSLFALESNVAAACSERKYADAVQLVVDAQMRLRDPHAGAFTVMPVLRPRVDAALESLRGRMDKALDGVCTLFDGAAYGATLLAFRELDESGVKAAVRSSHAAGGARVRAATTTGDEAEAGASEPSMPGDGHGNDGDDRGHALLAEVGGSIAAATAASTSGVLTIRGIGPADGNLASLVSHVTAAAAKAVKTLSKDVLIDLTLRDVRKRADAYEKERAERARAGLDEEDEQAEDAPSAGEEAPVERALQVEDVADELEAMRPRPRASSSTRSSKPETPSEEYARKRSDMRQRAFTDLCASVPAEDIPLACMRVAAAITHVMHNHYLLLQWHRHPFDPRNNYEECQFLHASALDDDFNPSEEDPDDASHIAAAKATAARTSARGDGSAFVQVLKDVRPFLLRGRSVVWQQMQQRFAAMLNACVSAAGVALPVERLAQCLIVARDLMTVGLEYVASADDGQMLPRVGHEQRAAAPRGCLRRIAWT